MMRRYLATPLLCLLLILPQLGWGEPAVQRYTCPMHPHYIADQMGSCPLCGMDLVPLAAGERPTSSSPDNPRNAVTIAPETIQNMGVRYGIPQWTEFGRRIRAFGMVMENERAQSVVASRVAGWIEKLQVTAVGDTIQQGMELYRLFSPDLVAAQRDLLSAAQQQGGGRLHAATQRLLALGVERRLINRWIAEKSLSERVPFYAEGSGTLSRLEVRQGSYVKPGMTLAVIQDYSRVWLNASVAEKDLSRITKQTPVRVLLPHLPGRKVATKIDYIHPIIDAASRTGTVRLLLDNQDGALRPGAYADVLFEVGVDRRLALPDGALLNDAQGYHVVLALGEGRFQPKAVKVGLSSGGFTEILEGLDEQQQVVISGQFLIDSESALGESFTKLERLKPPLNQLAPTPAQLAMLDHLVDAALYIHEAHIDGYAVEPTQLQPARDIKSLLWPHFGQTRLGAILTQAEDALSRAQQARTQAELLTALDQLVQALQPWIQQGAAQHYQAKGLHLFQHQGSPARYWLQLGAEAASPYGPGPSQAIPYPAAHEANHG
ncbi:transcriptional regulator, Fis family [Magnetococcus marinus MC-1]|uniref:Transcriptional regulator, Fis family n=1 Tax=Magnetococcus marinus (strain ATCC BAA-1437 / JCM 17883 / MC-1) TaxID=156889 RepID=A0LD27_MAGMM|nr:efflux RND transporter periplasmic adaptor subunit [Magnetococcus marinus]ABK45870.1 transcriptional regulator, Fis family [Magnetococcus marinus MC-1]